MNKLLRIFFVLVVLVCFKPVVFADDLISVAKNFLEEYRLANNVYDKNLIKFFSQDYVSFHYEYGNGEVRNFKVNYALIKQAMPAALEEAKKLNMQFEYRDPVFELKGNGVLIKFVNYESMAKNASPIEIFIEPDVWGRWLAKYDVGTNLYFNEETLRMYYEDRSIGLDDFIKQMSLVENESKE